MTQSSWVVQVALRSDLTWDHLGEAKRLKRFQLLDEDTRRGWSIGDDRQLWMFTVEASNIQEAMTKAVQDASDAFTDVDPQAEVVGLAHTGD
jgi:hypothetical protein